MQERLDYVNLQPKRILDLGCGRGGSFSALAARYPDAELIGLDVSPAMLSAGRAQKTGWRRWLGIREAEDNWRLAADASHLPLTARSTALVWSNLLLHWLDDPIPALAEAHRVLEIGGLLMFSTLGPDTLKELRTAFSDGYAHTQRFADMHDLGDMLVGCGFADPVMDMELITLTYPTVAALAADLRGLGQSNAAAGRGRGLFPPARWRAMVDCYERARVDGRLPATFEVIQGHAWKPAEGPRRTADGLDIVRLHRRPG